MLLAALLVAGAAAYNSTCVTKTFPDDDPILNDVEVTVVDRCPQQHGKITVRNIADEIKEIWLEHHVFPVSSSGSTKDIYVHEGAYRLEIVRRDGTNCASRYINVTVASVEECGAFYVYIVHKEEISFQQDNTTKPEEDVVH